MTLIPARGRFLALSPVDGVLAAATLLLGVVAAWTVTVERDPALGPAFAEVLWPVQLAMSVLVPFSGVRAVADLQRSAPSTDRPPGSRFRHAVALAVGFSLAGTLLAATATAWADGTWPSPLRAASAATGAVLVQVIAQLTGTGWGLLLRRPATAMAATIVVPMSATLLLGGIDPSGDLVRWLTPYGNARSLLAAAPDRGVLLGLGTVVLLWCVVPNGLGIRQLRAR